MKTEYYETFRDKLLTNNKLAFEDLTRKEERELTSLYYLDNVSEAAAYDFLTETLEACKFKETVDMILMAESANSLITNVKSTYVDAINEIYKREVQEDYEKECRKIKKIDYDFQKIRTM